MGFGNNKEKNRIIVNPCVTCNRDVRKKECSDEEFTACQMKQIMEKCLSFDYGAKYFGDAVGASLEKKKNRNEIIREIIVNVGNYIKS